MQILQSQRAFLLNCKNKNITLDHFNVDLTIFCYKYYRLFVFSCSNLPDVSLEAPPAPPPHSQQGSPHFPHPCRWSLPRAQSIQSNILSMYSRYLNQEVYFANNNGNHCDQNKTVHAVAALQKWMD